jgi:hypothetical protein
MTAVDYAPSVEASPQAVMEQPTKLRRSPRTRWWVALVVAIGLLITGAGAYVVHSKPGVYWSDVKVVFHVPRSAANPNVLLTTTTGLITLAGTVSRLVDPNAPSTHVVSPTVTLPNQGIRQGFLVSIPNDGGQWANNFDQPLLDVQAVGPTYDGVVATMQSLLRQINTQLVTLQDQGGVLPVNRVETQLSPSQPQIFYLTGSRVRATAATLLLGVSLTVAGALMVRRRLIQRQAPRVS